MVDIPKQELSVEWNIMYNFIIHCEMKTNHIK